MRSIMSFLSLKWISSRVDLIGWVLVVVVIALVSGVFTFLTGRSIPAGTVVFVPTLQYQSHSEFIVVFAFYAIATIGVALYFLAGSGRVSERNASYLVLLSVFLIVLGVVGLINGEIVKRFG